MGDIKLLDCTLRDGGYLNDWEFGYENLVNIFNRLVSAKLDIIEIGFLDERRGFDKNRSIIPNSAGVEEIYGGLSKGDSMVVGMIDYGTCAIDKLSPKSESLLDGIRVIFKKHDRKGALDFCRRIKNLGYKVFVQAVSITSYNEAEFDDLLCLVNAVMPYAFSIVDTYGLLHKKELQYYFSRANQRLLPQIGLGYHAHNNFQLAYSNCIEVLESGIERLLIVDGTLYGMGKSAGNAPIELLSDYMNKNLGKQYQIYQLLEAIDVTILDIARKCPWGYQFRFFLSALKDCHPNYVIYLQEKKKLSVKSISDILDRLEEDKKLLYDPHYIEELYLAYQKQACDDSQDKAKLCSLVQGRTVLLLAPGNNVIEQKERVDKIVAQKNPFIIAVNFFPQQYDVDGVFMSNAKRYVQLTSAINEGGAVLTMATSNITKAKGKFDLLFNYGSLLDEEAMLADNPMIMLIRLLDQVGVKDIYLAGFDGYSKAEKADYVNPNMAYTFSKSKALEINEDVIKGLAKYAKPSQMQFVTDSYYNNTM